MDWQTWVLYFGTVLALMSTPGPSHLLMLSNSISHGFGRSLFTAFGDLTANTLQMLAAGLGLAALIIASDDALTAIKLAGVLYLLWLGLRMIMNANEPSAALNPERRTSRKALWLQGFATSAVNPKAVVFFAALFPQFIGPDRSFWPQFLILSATYLIVDGLFLSTYGAASGWLGRRFIGETRRWLDRMAGSFMIVAAVLLALKSIRQSS